MGATDEQHPKPGNVGGKQRSDLRIRCREAGSNTCLKFLNLFVVTIDITSLTCYTAAKMKPQRLHQMNFRRYLTMTKIEKALALINTFATGDTEKAASLLAEGYIQHNLAYGTGRDAFVGSVAYLASAPVKTTVNNIRAFEDGDKVFLQTVYNFAGMGE